MGHNSKKSNSKKRNDRCKLKIVLIAFVLTLILAMLFGLNCRLNPSNQISDTTNVFEKPNAALPEGYVVNDVEMTVWEEILFSDLLFNKYIPLHNLSLKDMDAKYKNFISDYIIAPPNVNINSVYNHIDIFIAEGYLSDVTGQLSAIDMQIAGYSSPSDVPVELYKEEFVLRAKKYREVPSRENAYQTARTSMDILDLLRKSHLCSYKELLFYSAMAIDFYFIALDIPESAQTLGAESGDNHFIYYKLGIVFLMLYDSMEDSGNVTYPGMEAYRIHFLMCAQYFFNNCINIPASYENMPNTDDVYYYMTLITYREVRYFGYVEKIDECIECFKKFEEYLNSTEILGKNSRYQESYDIIENYLSSVSYNDIGY